MSVITPPPTSTTPPPTVPPTVVETAAIRNDQAITTLSDPIAVAELTDDQATELFDQIDVDTLTNTQAAILVTAVQNAPEPVRAAFEQEINIFDGAFDQYTPIGSTVTVAMRRALVAVTATLAVVSATAVIDRKRQ